MKDLWNTILARLEDKLDARELKTWFGPTREVSFVEGPGSPA